MRSPRFSCAPCGALFEHCDASALASRADLKAFRAGTVSFELLGGSTGRVEGAFASLSSSVLSHQHAASQPPCLLSQVPLFELARAATGPAVETGLRVIKVAGDGRCMFRALAQGLARNQGKFLGQAAEEQEADQLRLAVAEALCRTAARRNEFASAVYAVQAEDKLQNYCKRILSPAFWGGEPELLVLSQMLKVPILVYLPSQEAGRNGGGRGYVVIQRYGEQYLKKSKAGRKRRAVRLLYSGSNHYDLLLK